MSKFYALQQKKIQARPKTNEATKIIQFSGDLLMFKEPIKTLD